MRSRLILLTLPAALALAGVGSAAHESDPGVTSTSVLIGGTVPLSGEAAAAGNTARGADAYFRYVNAHGGVHKRKIIYKYLDDEYDPGRTVQDVRELVQQDNVFATFNILGTANNLAVRPFLNAVKVPQLFVASGATTWGRDFRKYPWTIGFIPSYSAEGEIYAHDILKTRPRSKIAILYQDDDYGQDLLSAFEKGLGAKGRRLIVAKQGYDPTQTDVQSQVARLRASNATTLMLFAFGKFAIQAFVYVKRLGWQPQIYLNAVAASSSVMAIASGGGQTEGTISISFFKDPAEVARWRQDAGYKLFVRILKKYLPGADTRDGYYMAGMASAYAMAQTLRQAGRNLTRAEVIRAAMHLNFRDPFTLPGIRIKTSPRDHFPIEQVQLERWHVKGGWKQFGKLLRAPR
jgi:ABC-type branched-subunit amino acid transport system substrate-binding protein